MFIAHSGGGGGGEQDRRNSQSDFVRISTQFLHRSATVLCSQPSLLRFDSWHTLIPQTIGKGMSHVETMSIVHINQCESLWQIIANMPQAAAPKLTPYLDHGITTDVVTSMRFKTSIVICDSP